MANIYWSKKKIVIVNINDNPVAKNVIETMKKEGFQNVVEYKAMDDYAAYYKIAQEKPAYTMLIAEGNNCKIQPCKVEGISRNQLGKVLSRDRSESHKAIEPFVHHLRMIGVKPETLGAEILPWEELRSERLIWFVEDKTPLISMKLPNKDGVAEAVCESVKEYFAE